MSEVHSAESVADGVESALAEGVLLTGVEVSVWSSVKSVVVRE